MSWLAQVWDTAKGGATVAAGALPASMGLGFRAALGDVELEDVGYHQREQIHNLYLLGSTGEFETGGETRRASDFPKFAADTYRDVPVFGSVVGGGVDLTRGAGSLVETVGETASSLGKGAEAIAGLNDALDGLLLPGLLVAGAAGALYVISR